MDLLSGIIINETVSMGLDWLRKQLEVFRELVRGQRGVGVYLLGGRGVAYVIVVILVGELINIIWISVDLLASDRSFT